jgi:serine/threonine-protein phosphatase PGAM5
MAQRMIYLIRHGQYESQPDDGELGGTLTDLGKQQAQMVAALLSGMEITAIHCSTMRRAEETALIIAQSVSNGEPHLTELLWELVPTIPPHLEAYFRSLSEQNTQFDIDEVPEKRAIADQAFETFFHPASNIADNIVLVCHGNLIRYLVCRALDIDPDRWSNMHINHCSLTSVLIEPDGNMMLVSYNETGHLPKHMKTEH